MRRMGPVARGLVMSGTPVSQSALRALVNDRGAIDFAAFWREHEQRRIEFEPCELMSGFDRLMREIALYLDFVALARS